LTLIDILQAVEFVSMQHDDDLWEELIKQCLNKPEMVKAVFVMQITTQTSLESGKLVSM
jgi:hypothetical protein